MTLLKKLLGLVTACCLLMTAAAAADGDSDNDRFRDKTWEEVTEEFLAERGIGDDHIGIGYRNTVTGEEHYLNADTFYVGASLYKVPLNMYFCEKIYNGEMTGDDLINGTKYSYLRETSLVNSDNGSAGTLWLTFVTYRAYREAIAQYMGEDPDTVDEQYYGKLNNYFTPREMIYCMNLLQTQSERFPGILDALLRAEPNGYFKYHEQPCEVAQKYGYLNTYGDYDINCAAIVYTEEPFALVVFTVSVNHVEEIMADYCTLMIDYTEYRTEQNRLADEAEASAAPEAAPTPSPSPAPTAPAAENDPPHTSDPASYLVPLAAAAVLLAVLAVILYLKRKDR